MNVPTRAPTGKVYLVGAGPGDPGLITLRGAQCLARAEVVLYDYLVNPVLLMHAPASAEAICLGQHGHSRIWSQAEINARLVELALQGKTVVRLKGGDPAVFSRGAEEMEALVEHGIPFEMVPGITAALAAGSCAGLPVTHRDLASAVALVTGQESPSKENGSSIDFAALAVFPGTLAFYMGVTTAPQWTAALVAAGKPPATPAAIIRRCSLPNQAIIRCTLGEVAERLVSPARIRPPVIVIVGEVAALGERFDWFSRRPLFGQTVLITRAEHQAAELHTQLVEFGAATVAQPAIEIRPPASWDAVDRALDDLHRYAWLVLASSNGVRYFMGRLADRGLDARAIGPVRIAAMGSGTARELAQYHLRADLTPEEYHSEDMAARLAAGAAGQRFLIVRASRGRDVLAPALRAAGGRVDEVVVYRSDDVAQPDPDVQRLLDDGEIQWATVTSSAIARSLVAMLGERLRNVRLASISPITSGTLRELGYPPAVEARAATMDALVDAIVQQARTAAT